jgi:hypothetical protein
LNKTTMTGDRFIEAFLNGLAGEGLKHGNKDRRTEYRRGNPHASEAEIQMLLDAGEKAGAVPHNLDHARLILSDSVFVFTPAPDSPYGRDAKRFAAFHHWPVPDRRSYSSVGWLIMARTIQQFAAQHPDLDPEMMTGAITLEKRALEAIAAGVSEILLAPLDLSKIPGNSPRPPPTERDFDNAALARMKADRDRKVREAAMARTLEIVAAILADADSFDAGPLAPSAP